MLDPDDPEGSLKGRQAGSMPWLPTAEGSAEAAATGLRLRNGLSHRVVDWGIAMGVLDRSVELSAVKSSRQFCEQGPSIYPKRSPSWIRPRGGFAHKRLPSPIAIPAAGSQPRSLQRRRRLRGAGQRAALPTADL